jgi:hypothetical protein
MKADTVYLSLLHMLHRYIQTLHTYTPRVPTQHTCLDSAPHTHEHASSAGAPECVFVCMGWGGGEMYRRNETFAKISKFAMPAVIAFTGWLKTFSLIREHFVLALCSLVKYDCSWWMAEIERLVLKNPLSAIGLWELNGRGLRVSF